MQLADRERELDGSVIGEETGKESLANGTLWWRKEVSISAGLVLPGQQPKKEIYYTCAWVGLVGDGWLKINVGPIPGSKDKVNQWIPSIIEKVRK